MAATIKKHLANGAFENDNAQTVKTKTDLSLGGLIARMNSEANSAADTGTKDTSAGKSYSGLLSSLSWQKPTASTSGKATGGSSGSPAPTTPTNPYATQMATAQGQMNGPVPTYTDSYAQRIGAMEQNGPDAYASRYQPTIDSMLEQLKSRKAFGYNMSQDPLYRQYAAMYAQQGKRAMQDTVGQMATLTGGYGNSYAQTAGQQAYQNQLNQLNDKALDLYALARQNYDQEGADMRAILSAYQTAENQDRQNYESDRADWYNRLNTLRDGQAMEYQQYQDAVDDYWNKQQAAWNQYTYWNDLWEKRQGY